MVFGITTYTDPGVYQQEVIVPSGINIPAQPFTVCLVGTGSRNKRVTNEAVMRGIVKAEAIVPAVSSPHNIALANRSNRRLESTTVYKTLNGITTPVLDTYISFDQAYVLGTETGTSDLTPNNAIALEMDGKEAVTLTFTDGGSTSVTLSGRQIDVVYPFADPNLATITEIAAAINAGLAAAGTLGYGAAYSTVASVVPPVTGALQITSPDTIPRSQQDVRVFDPHATITAVTDIFGAPGPTTRDAQSIIRISDTVWSASATWTVDYVKAVDDADPLAQTSNIQRLVSVGSSPGGTNFSTGLDYLLTSNEVDWTPDTAAVLTGIAGAPTFDISPNDSFVLNMDGKTSAVSGTINATVDLVGLAPPPLGYANPVDPNLATAAEIVVNVNAVAAQHFGPRYKAIATAVTVDGTPRVRITSPIEGASSSYVRVSAASATNALATIFGAATESLGTGRRPAVGSTYFATYEYTRPSAEYDVPMRHFSSDAAIAQVGAPSPEIANYNPLAIASQVAFENGAQFIYTVQVNDLVEGAPTRAQVKEALDGAATIAGATEIVVVGEPGTRLDVTTDMVDHLETQCSPIEKHYRRIFCGMASETAIGERDNAASLVGRATRTLQVAAASPGRGRMFLIAPPQQDGVTRNVVFEDGSEARLSLDATYLAVAVAARRTSLLGPAETLTRRTITGFNTDDITSPWKPAERRTLAGQGVLVITADAGRLIMLDALSTEGGGGGKESFKVDSTSYQKDIIVTKINQALDANIVGIVPFDLATFILDIKLVIQGVIVNEISKGTIGPFRVKETGATRPLDLRADIRVEQNRNTPTEFNFDYFFHLRYPALRLFGQYSVDSPFFSLSA